MKVGIEHFGCDKLLLKFKYMKNIFKLMMDVFFTAVISANTHCYFKNIFNEFKVLEKVFTTETLNVEFHNKFIKL